jgi:GT2 family glycosyltransferase
LTELARGEYIAPTDSDDVCLPHRLETLLAAANKNPDAAVVFGKTRVVDVNDNTLYFYGKKYDPYELFIDNYITNGGLIIRRDIFNKINGYNTEIVWAEDYDLRLRLGLERRFVFVDEEVYVYRMHDQNWTAKKINLDEVNQFRYALFLECKNYVKDMVATIPITYKTMICLRYISAWHAIVGDIEKSVQYKVILEQLLKKDIAAVHALKRMLLPSDG